MTTIPVATLTLATGYIKIAAPTAAMFEEAFGYEYGFWPVHDSGTYGSI